MSGIRRGDDARAARSAPGVTSPVCCDRRAFVGWCAAAALAPVLAGCASVVVRPVTPVDGRIELPLRLHPELMEAGGSLKLLPDGSDAPLYVLVLEDGEVAAVSPICTHLGCTVDIAGARLVCPCHGSTYDRAGRVLQGPAERALTRYRVDRTQDGMLLIDLTTRT